VSQIRLAWFSYCCRKQWTSSSKGRRKSAKFWKMMKASSFPSVNNRDSDRSATSGTDFIKLHLGQNLLSKKQMKELLAKVSPKMFFCTEESTLAKNKNSSKQFQIFKSRVENLPKRVF
jgi:hypothetical protein